MFNRFVYFCIVVFAICPSGVAQKSSLSFEDYVREGDMAGVLKKIAEDRSIRFPLHVASEIGNVDVITALLDAGYHVDASNGKGERPLHKAAANGKTAAATLLLSRGARANMKTNNGQVPLHLSAQRGYQALCDVLLANGADINAAGNIGNTAVHLALIAGATNTSKSLLKNKHFDLFSRNREGLDCFDIAIDHEQTEALPMIIYLAALPSTLSAEKSKNYFVEGIQRAVIANKAKSLAVLQKFCGVVDEDFDLLPPYFTAAEYGCFEVLKLYLDNGLDVNSQLTGSNVSLLHMAVTGNSVRAVELLIDRGANIELQDSMKWTPLHFGMFFGHVNVIGTLIARGADTNAQDYRGFTPTHLAVRSGNSAIVQMAMENGGDLDAKNKDGVTPLQLAYGKLKEALKVELIKRKPTPKPNDIASMFVLAGFMSKLDEYMSENDVDVNAIKSEFSMFHGAIQAGNVEMVKFLVDHGADVHLKSKISEWSPLHLAAVSLNLEVIEFLLAKGASINEVDSQGMTPLHVAAFQSKASLLREQANKVWDLLVEEGADMNLRNARGQLAEDLRVEYITE